MNILEKEIEELIWYGIIKDRTCLSDKGLNIPKAYFYFRQLEIGNYGRTDIVGVDIPLMPNYGRREISIHLLEIKKEEINIDTFLQAIRYCNGIKRMITNELYNCFVSFRIDLIGKSASKTDFIYLPNLFAEISLYTYSIDFRKGIVFNKEKDYCLPDESFPSLTQFKDFTKNKLKQLIEARGKVDDLPF